jgi:hypothetical protein
MGGVRKQGACKGPNQRPRFSPNQQGIAEVGVLVLKTAALVYLANPKTATQSIRAALAPFAKETPAETTNKHVNAQAYGRKWAGLARQIMGQTPETFALMREPLDHWGSWYRYRQRDALRGHENATHHVSFAEFIAACLQDDPPPFAQIGRQDRFLGFLGPGPAVNYVFDYAQMGVLMTFLQERLGVRLDLPLRNVSPLGADADLALPAALMARLRAEHAGQFALYQRVSDQGMLRTRS